MTLSGKMLKLITLKNWLIVGLLALQLMACTKTPLTPSSPEGTPKEPGQRKSAPSVPKARGDVVDGYVETLPPLPKEGFFLKKIGDGTYFFSTGHYNTMFVVAKGGVILIDPIRGAGNLLKKAIARVTPDPVKFLIYTNARLDRIGDAHLFSENAEIIAHESAQTLLIRYQDRYRPRPRLAFRQNYTLNFGGKKLELIYPGPSTGGGNSMIYLEKEKVLLFAGIGGPRALPGEGFGTIDLFGQVVGLQKAVKLDFKTWVSGQGPRIGSRDELKQVLQYYYDSRKANVQAMRRVKFQEATAKTHSRDPLFLVDRYHRALAQDCFQMLKSVWKQRMMGFEAFALSHCSAWTKFHLTHKPPQ